MTQSTRDMTTLAFAAPLVMAHRMSQMAMGTMTPAEFTRMWVEKPMAMAASLATVQTEMAMAAMAAAGNPFFRKKNLETVMGTALRPYARAVSANKRRLSR